MSSNNGDQRSTSLSLEMDISEQLSKFRDQTIKYGRKDEFGRDIDPYRDDRMRGRERDYHSRERYRDRSHERDRSHDRDYDAHDFHARDRVYCGDHREYKDRRRLYDHRDRDRSWDWDDRDWTRDKERYPEHGRDAYRDEYHERSERFDRGYENRDGYVRDDLSYLHKEPSDIIMLKNLPPNILDEDIHSALKAMEVKYKDIRLIRNKYGVSRGFAFVEFADIKTSLAWMEKTNGRVTIGGQLATLSFSKPKVSTSYDKDWICVKCGTQNFHSKQRDQCFSCDTPKEDSIGDGEKAKEMISNPCKVLILKGLDTLTTEEAIKKALSDITALPIYDVRLIRDKVTNTSRGFCFVEFGSVLEASQLLEILTNMSPPFEIDNKPVGAAYAHYSSPPGANKQGSNNSTSTTEPSLTSSTTTTTTASAEQASSQGSKIAANAIAQAQAAAQMGFITQPPAYQNSQTYQQPTVAAQADTSAVSTTATQAAQNTNATPESFSQYHPPTVPQAQTAVPQLYAAPQALSSYIYDPNTGYYYDSSTGLYYDSNSGYYYNSMIGQYLYWDATTQQYVAVANKSNVQVSTAETTKTNTETSTTEDMTSQKDKQKKQKSLSAKKIAKDMERWAKSLNQSKEAKKEAAAAAIAAAEEAKKQELYQTAPPDFGKKSVESNTSLNIVKNFEVLSNVPTAVASPLASLSMVKQNNSELGIVAQYGGDSDDEDNDAINHEFTDLGRLACLLCKRQFPTKEVLKKHQQFSDLHKQNLEQHKKGKMTEGDVETIARNIAESKYRDRAKERRELYQQPTKPVASSHKKRGISEVIEQPTKEGIGGSNIGNQMLKAMGWTEGTGLGKERQGITVPIQAKVRSQNAGLGLQGSSYGTMAGDSSKDALKKLAMSRYNELN